MNLYVGRKRQEQISNIFMVMVYALLLIWTLTTCIECHLDSAIIALNTNFINSNLDLSYSVESIDEDGTLYLNDSSIIYSDSVEQYVRVTPGTGTYYFKEGSIMVVEVTNDNSGPILLRIWVITILMVCCSALMMILYNSKVQKITIWFFSIIVFVVTSYEIWYSTVTLKGFSSPTWVMFIAEVILFIVVNVFVNQFDTGKLKRYL